jgi:GNAT superfamily N-acetyltransferase
VSIQPFTVEDLTLLQDIQPEGWKPIAPVFQFYLQSSFCFPIRFSIDGNLAGVGSIIFHGETAWLAHIIVSPSHRNKGLGTHITKALIDHAERRQCKTISLLATTLGEPVYAKLGFIKELDYLFLQHPKPEHVLSQSIHSYTTPHREQLLKLDLEVSGEDRKELLNPHLKNSRTISVDGQLAGFYIPTLGEGLVVAEDSKTGLTLLSERLTVEKNRIAVPSQNKSAIDFLLAQGYSEFSKGSRMYLGDKLAWQPSKLYSRIGGNLG